MSYKALHNILCSVKRHMNARVIFRCCRGRHKRQYCNIVSIQSVPLSVTKMEVGRDVVGGLSSKSKKRELVVGDA